MDPKSPSTRLSNPPELEPQILRTRFDPPPTDPPLALTLLLPPPAIVAASAFKRLPIPVTKPPLFVYEWLSPTITLWEPIRVSCPVPALSPMMRLPVPLGVAYVPPAPES